MKDAIPHARFGGQVRFEARSQMILIVAFFLLSATAGESWADNLIIAGSSFEVGLDGCGRAAVKEAAKRTELRFDKPLTNSLIGPKRRGWRKDEAR